MTLSVLGAIKGKVISKMVGKKSRSVYRKKRKRNFSGRRKQKEESEETAPDVDDSKETVGSSRKKLNIPLLLYSSDEEYTFNTEESEGYRLINVKNLSTAVSKAHVCEKGEKFFEIYVFLCSRL